MLAKWISNALSEKKWGKRELETVRMKEPDAEASLGPQARISSDMFRNLLEDFGPLASSNVFQPPGHLGVRPVLLNQ